MTQCGLASGPSSQAVAAKRDSRYTLKSMVLRARSFVLAGIVAATTLALVTGCEGDDEDDCIQCCECSNDNTMIAYRPEAPGDCSNCEEQCQVLADREFLGQEFDNVKRVSCPD